MTDAFGFSHSLVAQIMDVTPKTLSRYLESAKPLSDQQTDRIEVVQALLALGERVLGSPQEVKHWLRQPIHSLENQVPMDLIVLESGRRRIENVLLQLEAGVY